MSKITYNNIELTLANEADYSNRLLPGGYVNINDVSDGESYDLEVFSRAKDADGNKYLVYWIYKDIKGEDGNGLDSYDYRDDKIDRIQAL